MKPNQIRGHFRTFVNDEGRYRKFIRVCNNKGRLVYSIATRAIARERFGFWISGASVEQADRPSLQIGLVGQTDLTSSA